MDNSIRTIEIEQEANGTYHAVQVFFGPHYFVDIRPDEDGVLTVYIGATHHGFKAHAAEVMDELERIIEDVRKRFPASKID